MLVQTPVHNSLKTHSAVFRCLIRQDSLRISPHQMLMLRTIATLFASFILGFLGGIAGHRFSTQRLNAQMPPATKAHTFELLDSSGRVASIWTTDEWGRPVLVFNEAKWEGRIVIGPINESDVVTSEPPDANSAWGISVTAPGRAAHAVLATTTNADTKRPTAGISLSDGQRTWVRDPLREQR
jgi:hypothetical protein